MKIFEALQQLVASGILPLLGPMALVLPLGLPSNWLNAHAKLAARAAEALAAFALAVYVLVALLAFDHVPGTIHLLGTGPSLLTLRLDSLSITLDLLVSFLAYIVIRYSKTYLRGEPRHGYFMKWLCLTCACVLFLIETGNLLLFALAWSATSWCLHRLLVFYPTRPGALLAAQKKFLFSRLGDVCLLAVLVLVYREFQTWDFDSLFKSAEELRLRPELAGRLGINAIGYLLVICAGLKSAQFPFHSWLPDTMETPTPVSALMHAGIINAGGFLIVRLSPVITLCPGALSLLALLGGFTALFASLTMLTHASVKRSLAFSTVAQMGFMMLECGLGAFSLAILHLVAHSLYKAHAFLSSGSIIALAKSKWVPVGRAQAHPFILVAALGLAGGATWAAATVWGVHPLAAPRHLILVLMLLLGQAYMLWNLLHSSWRGALLVWGILMAATLSLAYFGLHRGFEIMLSPTVRDQSFPWADWNVAAGLAVFVLFLVVLIFQTQLPQWQNQPWSQALYVHARNGFYFGTLANLVVLKIFPPKPNNFLATEK